MSTPRYCTINWRNSWYRYVCHTGMPISCHFRDWKGSAGYKTDSRKKHFKKIFRPIHKLSLPLKRSWVTWWLITRRRRRSHRWTPQRCRLVCRIFLCLRCCWQAQTSCLVPETASVYLSTRTWTPATMPVSQPLCQPREVMCKERIKITATTIVNIMIIYRYSYAQSQLLRFVVDLLWVFFCTTLTSTFNKLENT